ncbi:Uncharacterized protein TCAP_00052 [Tolypocladium capitatum]|uniref:Vps72/YL1 C-terminal domain-containing protein n=1 Tax=Tolypocladium capitatum TaxID=45235 RepID=A0A2K3QR72_9HYPO|nr:Uncharacterized protein TCAP_00052 [Tolypocladium capitatum]
MDSESKTSDRDGSRLSDPPTDSDADADDDVDSSDSDTEAQRTEWLATTRQRRSTAGNRMKAMLANEEPDSDLELLFAEDVDDQGFSDVEGDASDVQMDSSSDDDDDNNNVANNDDLEGEKELERQAKERRAAERKRKAQEAIPAKFRKKVRIDPTTPAAPAPRPKKKSERASWLPSPADLPTRASSRQTTRTSKEQLHQQMVEREARRLRQLAQMQKKAAKLEAIKRPPMTQEERLAEAAVVEKRNSKSLNRWEEAEKQREEERRAKLAALNNRTLKGPVITFWSGVRAWKDALGQHVTMVEEKPKKKTERADKGAKGKGKGKGKDGGKAATPEVIEKKTDEKDTAAGDAALAPKADLDHKPTDGAPGAEPTTQDALKERPTVTYAASQPPAGGPKQEETPRLMEMPPLPPPPSPAPPSGLAAPAPPPLGPGPSPLSRPSGVLAAPVLAPPPGIGVNGAPPTNGPKSNVLALPNTSPRSAPPSIQGQSARPGRPAAAPAPAASEPKPAVASCETHLQPIQNEAVSASKSASPSLSEAPQAPAEPARNSTTARNAIIYRSFDENAMRDKTVQTQILFGRKMTKLSKPTPAPLCVITNHPARYRDSKTGLPYYNATAYREIQRLHKGDYRWSRLIGAWAGSGTLAARGVPERFLHPEPEEERKKRLGEKKKKADEEEKQAEEKKRAEEAKAAGQEEKKPPVADAVPAAGAGDGNKAGEEATAAPPAPPAQQTTADSTVVWVSDRWRGSV